jgi:hypothetical protein
MATPMDHDSFHSVVPPRTGLREDTGDFTKRGDHQLLSLAHFSTNPSILWVESCRTLEKPVIPITWALLQWAPWLIASMTVVALLGPLAGVLCALEIYIRWLIGLWFPESPARLPGGPSLIEGNSLLASSLVTYALIPVLYILVETVVLPPSP